MLNNLIGEKVNVARLDRDEDRIFHEYKGTIRAISPHGKDLMIIIEQEKDGLLEHEIFPSQYVDIKVIK